MLPCPRCHEGKKIRKKGIVIRASDRKKIQRYACLRCHKQYSCQVYAIDYRYRKRWKE